MLPKTLYDIIGAARRAALSNGCTKIVLLTQSVGPVKDLIGVHGAGGGVCSELTMQWLAAQKTQQDFLGALIGIGGVADADRLGVVVRDYKAMGDKDRKQQRKFMENRMQDLKLTPKPTEVRNARDIGAASIGAWFCQSPEDGPLRIINIRGGTDHSMALNLTPGREAFFDPNLGEFQFHGRAQQMQDFLDSHVFRPTGDKKNIGDYLGRVKMPYAQIERIVCK